MAQEEMVSISKRDLQAIVRAMSTTIIKVDYRAGMCGPFVPVVQAIGENDLQALTDAYKLASGALDAAP